jgi:hypothetical protein
MRTPASSVSTQSLNTTAIDTLAKTIKIIPSASPVTIQHSNDNITFTLWNTLTTTTTYNGGKRYIRSSVNDTGAIVILSSFYQGDVTRIESLITAGTEWAEKYLVRVIGSQQWLWTLDRWPDDFTYFPIPDLVQIDSVKYIDKDGNEFTLDTSIYQASNGYYSRFCLQYGKMWPTTTLQSMDAIQITFTCGLEPVPELVKIGLMEWITCNYNSKEDLSKAVYRLLDSYVVVTP